MLVVVAPIRRATHGLSNHPVDPRDTDKDKRHLGEPSITINARVAGAEGRRRRTVSSRVSSLLPGVGPAAAAAVTVEMYLWPEINLIFDIFVLYHTNRPAGNMPSSGKLKGQGECPMASNPGRL